MTLPKNISVIAAAVVVILGAVGYYAFMAGDEEVITESGPATEAQATFLTLAGQLESISFDQSVLSDPRFTSLVDIKTAIIPETEGRTDPFAPLPGVPVAR